MTNLYVVSFTEHLRDGEENGAKIVHSLEEALKLINSPRWNGDNYSYQIFELGREIPIRSKVVKKKKEVVIKEHVVYEVKK